MGTSILEDGFRMNMMCEINFMQSNLYGGVQTLLKCMYVSYLKNPHLMSSITRHNFHKSVPFFPHSFCSWLLIILPILHYSIYNYPMQNSLPQHLDSHTQSDMHGAVKVEHQASKIRQILNSGHCENIDS
jgi:hypothetical protein